MGNSYQISNEVMGRLDILLNKRERDALREGVIAPDKMHEIALISTHIIMGKLR